MEQHETELQEYYRYIFRMWNSKFHSELGINRQEEEEEPQQEGGREVCVGSVCHDVKLQMS